MCFYADNNDDVDADIDDDDGGLDNILLVFWLCQNSALIEQGSRSQHGSVAILFEIWLLPQLSNKSLDGGAMHAAESE